MLTLYSQLESMFEGMMSVIDTYRVIQPTCLASCYDAELQNEAAKFRDIFKNNVSPRNSKANAENEETVKINLNKVIDIFSEIEFFFSQEEEVLKCLK
ncbi:hypothetical protein J6590_035601 [Homalodisca vitripennis]|nr:hypothetical protein J6590_035601 [Homalodisca vitripennis]